MPQSTLQRPTGTGQSIASDRFNILYHHRQIAHNKYVTYNKKAFKVPRAAPCQNHPTSSPTGIVIALGCSVPQPWPGSSGRVRQARAGRGRGRTCNSPQAPLRHPRPGLRLRRHCSGAPWPRPGRQPLVTARSSPEAHWPGADDGRGFSQPGVARSRSRFHGDGNAAGAAAAAAPVTGDTRERGCGLPLPKTSVMLWML